MQSQIVGLLNELLNQTARMRKGGMQAVYFCPCCHHYKRKLEINLETGQWHCWTCNIKGSFLGSFLNKLKAPKTYRDRLLKLTGDLRLVQGKKKTTPDDVSLPEEFLPLSQPRNTPEYKNAMMYLKRRGIIREDILRYNIGYCENGPYAYHIIIPSYDAKGNLNFFMGRRYYESEGTIPHKKPDMVMSSQRDELSFDWNNPTSQVDGVIGFESFVNYNDPIILVESVFNAITIRRNTIPLFGKIVTQKLHEAFQLNKVKVVYVCLDTDATKDAVKLCKNLLDKGITPYLVTLIGGKDANEIGFEQSWNCIKSAVEVDFCFLLKHSLNS